ncbi:uncharacterized protein OCT59_001298 [Rhizophagus irregularis]|uniref:uncharacterized protein n=1 Tax=Rhizophagus irregularis TaxID=588596 RepID=UPI00331A2941|nr:hypothetical protein OCT59_001298 [Rhizophagus irregularis]
MSKLNKDILFLIFEELREDSKSLFSCLMINRLWCETAIPILWRNPWCYNEFITNQEIQLPSGSNQSLLFDYFSYCRSVNVNIIKEIISIGSDLDYNQFNMQQKFYFLFMKKCLELKYFDMRSIKHQIFQFPEAMLIEVQKNLKYFQWDDDFDYGYFTDNDPYEKVFLALEKKLKSQLFARYVENYEHTLLQEVLPKFYNIKILTIDVYLFFNEEKLEKLQMQAYRELEILNIEGNRLNVISSIIENSGANLKKILFEPYNIDYEYDEFNGNSAHFIELEKLLGVCKNLKSLLIVILDDDDTCSLNNGEELLRVLIRSMPTNLKEIRFSRKFKFSLKNLEEFLEEWKGRHALSLFTTGNDIDDDCTKVINEYKREGVIKNFENLAYVDFIGYITNICFS